MSVSADGEARKCEGVEAPRPSRRRGESSHLRARLSSSGVGNTRLLHRRPPSDSSHPQMVFRLANFRLAVSSSMLHRSSVRRRKRSRHHFAGHPSHAIPRRLLLGLQEPEIRYRPHHREVGLLGALETLCNQLTNSKFYIDEQDLRKTIEGSI